MWRGRQPTGHIWGKREENATAPAPRLSSEILPCLFVAGRSQRSLCSTLSAGRPKETADVWGIHCEPPSWCRVPSPPQESPRPVPSHPQHEKRRGRGRTGQAQPRRQRAGSQELPGTGEPGLDCISAGAVTSPNLLHLSPFASSPRRAGSYRFSELASVRSQMSCTTSRCLTLRKRGAAVSCEPRGLRAAVLQPALLPAPLPAQLAPTDAATAPPWAPGCPAAAPSPGSAPSRHGFRVGCSVAPRRACPAPSWAAWVSRCGPSAATRAIRIRTAQWGQVGPWGPEFEAREEWEAPLLQAAACRVSH